MDLNKLFTLSILVGGALFLYSCGDSNYAKFTEPQPVNTAIAPSFDRKIRGKYFPCEGNSPLLIIDAHKMVNETPFETITHQDAWDIDSTASKRAKKRHVQKTMDRWDPDKVKIKGDSIVFNGSYLDTLFLMDATHRIKKFQGQHVLNTQLEPGLWKVKLLSLEGDTLRISTITASDTLMRFDFVEKEELLNEEGDVTGYDYILSPDKQGFDALLRGAAFEESDCYCRKKRF